MRKDSQYGGLIPRIFALSRKRERLQVDGDLYCEQLSPILGNLELHGAHIHNKLYGQRFSDSNNPRHRMECNRANNRFTNSRPLLFRCQKTVVSENRSNIKVRSRIMMVTTLQAGQRQLIDEKVTLPAIRTDSTRMKEGEEEEEATYTYCSATTRQFEDPGRKHVSQIGRESDSVTCRLQNLAKERFPCTASHGVYDSDVMFFV